MTSTTRSSFSRTAVSSSWLFIMKPPSPQTASTRFFGLRHFAVIAEGRPAPIVEQQRVGDGGAVVAGKPDLVHAVIEADDTILRHRLAHVVHEALRNDGE